MLNIFISLFLLSFTFLTHASDFQFTPSSSVPSLSSPWLVDIDSRNITSNTVIKVKIFPHTLRQDWRHGVPDNKRTLSMNAKSDFTFSVAKRKYQTKNLKINLVSGKLSLSFNGIKVKTSNFTISTTDSNSITFFRINSPTKLHHYSNHIKVSASSTQITVINELPIEEYLRGVVPSESPASWPLETLKAQTVAARTYSYYHYLTRSKYSYHVDDTARFQVFTGLSHVTPKSDTAIKETVGEILKYNGKVIVAFFHSYSGGTTDSALNIFKSRNAPYCKGDDEVFSREELLKEMPSSVHWIVNWITKDLTSRQVLAKLKAHRATRSSFTKFDSKKKIDIVELTYNPKSGTAQTLRIKQGNKIKNIDFTVLRTVIGWSKFPSYHFRVHYSASKDIYNFKGHGWGHHVGMSQWGAYMMAKNHSLNYREILNHYYSKVTISRI